MQLNNLNKDLFVVVSERISHVIVMSGAFLSEQTASPQASLSLLSVRAEREDEACL